MNKKTIDKVVTLVLKVIVITIGEIALIPTNIVRLWKNDPEYHLETITKTIDFALGIAVLIIGTIGTLECYHSMCLDAADVHIQLGVYLLLFFLKMPIMFICISALILSIYSHFKTWPKMKKEIWDLKC